MSTEEIHYFAIEIFLISDVKNERVHILIRKNHVLVKFFDQQKRDSINVTSISLMIMYELIEFKAAVLVILYQKVTYNEGHEIIECCLK